MYVRQVILPLVLLVASIALAEGPLRAVEEMGPRPPTEVAPVVEDPTVAEAKTFYDGLADSTKRSAYASVADACDDQHDGIMERRMKAPSRFGILRLYPKAYDLAKRVARLPLARQQAIYAYVHAHQLRSGWIK